MASTSVQEPSALLPTKLDIPYIHERGARCSRTAATKKLYTYLVRSTRYFVCLHTIDTYRIMLHFVCIHIYTSIQKKNRLHAYVKCRTDFVCFLFGVVACDHGWKSFLSKQEQVLRMKVEGTLPLYAGQAERH